MTKEELGTTIRTMRLSRNMTQGMLAEALHVTTSAVTMYESGKRTPDLNKLNELADIFNVPLQALLTTEAEKSAIQSKPSVVSYEPWDPDDMGKPKDENIVILSRMAHNMTPEQSRKLKELALVLFREDFDENGNKREKK